MASADSLNPVAVPCVTPPICARIARLRSAPDDCERWCFVLVFPLCGSVVAGWGLGSPSANRTGGAGARGRFNGRKPRRRHRRLFGCGPAAIARGRRAVHSFRAPRVRECVQTRGRYAVRGINPPDIHMDPSAPFLVTERAGTASCWIP